MTSSAWKRVSRGRPCPICGKADWCLIVGEDSNPEAAICSRIESSNRRGEAGWLHRLRTGGDHSGRRSFSCRVDVAGNGPGQDFAELAQGYARLVDDAHLARLAASLGLQADTLRRFGVGWSPLVSAWSFPMRDGDGRTVGVHLRKSDGFKLSVTGSKLGLFTPVNLGDQVDGLVICEGMTDTATMIEMEFRAVGRASCSTGQRDLVALVRRLQVRQVCIVADADAVGLRGANNLASTLAAYLPGGVRVITPPDGLKDARSWYLQGATRADVLELIKAAPLRRLQVRTVVQTKGGNHAR